jgi:hypothetical protein
MKNEIDHEEWPARRRLNDDELTSIKEQLLESIYADIGKSIVKKILWIIGAVSLSAFAWMKGAGKI